MKKHILIEHPATWRKLKIANVALDLEEPHQEKSKMRFDIG
jgi:hypothetical protein